MASHDLHPNPVPAACITGIFVLEWGLIFNPVLNQMKHWNLII